MMRNLMLAASRSRRTIPVGQAFFNTNGTFQWVCPENVTKVSLALVGTGGSSQHQNLRNGAGGNARYVNDIDVIPGTVYIVTVPAQKGLGDTAADNTTSAFGYTANSALTTIVKGANGTPSGQYLSSSSRQGGAAGMVPAGTTGRGLDLKTFLPTAPIDFTGGPGGGGGGYLGSSGRKGGLGAVRIIWGEGRVFPDQNIGDV